MPLPRPAVGPAACTVPALALELQAQRSTEELPPAVIQAPGMGVVRVY